MKILFAAVPAMLLLGYTLALAAEKQENGPAALESKLIGAWRGDGPCTGGLTFRADRTYDRRCAGPGCINSAGTWDLRWNSLPPTLVLTCKTSDDLTLIRSQEIKLIQLDEQTLAFKYPTSEHPTLYSRETK